MAGFAAESGTGVEIHATMNKRLKQQGCQLGRFALHLEMIIMIARQGRNIPLIARNYKACRSELTRQRFYVVIHASAQKLVGGNFVVPEAQGQRLFIVVAATYFLHLLFAECFRPSSGYPLRMVKKRLVVLIEVIGARQFVTLAQKLAQYTIGKSMQPLRCLGSADTVNGFVDGS